MSQQKVLFAVFAVAALVATVSGQSVQPATCLKNLQKIVSDYVGNFQSLAQTYSQGLVESGNSAFDAESFNKDVQDLIQQYTAFTNISNGISVEQSAQRALRIVRSQFALSLKYFLNPSLALSASESSINAGSKILSENVKLARQITTACPLNN